jgi:hypothetical protein
MTELKRIVGFGGFERAKDDSKIHNFGAHE